MEENWTCGSAGNVLNNFVPQQYQDSTLRFRRGRVEIAESFLHEIFMPKGTVITGAEWQGNKLVIFINHKDLDIIEDDAKESPMVMIEYERVEVERKFIK